jgi:hypothetical protein
LSIVPEKAARIDGEKSNIAGTVGWPRTDRTKSEVTLPLLVTQGDDRGDGGGYRDAARRDRDLRSDLVLGVAAQAGDRITDGARGAAADADGDVRAARIAAGGDRRGVGLGAGYALTKAMSSLLFGISAADPMTYAAVAAGLGLAAAVASYVPSRRVTAVEPMESLRAE